MLHIPMRLAPREACQNLPYQPRRLETYTFLAPFTCPLAIAENQALVREQTFVAGGQITFSFCVWHTLWMYLNFFFRMYLCAVCVSDSVWEKGKARAVDFVRRSDHVILRHSFLSA